MKPSEIFIGLDCDIPGAINTTSNVDDTSPLPSSTLQGSLEDESSSVLHHHCHLVRDALQEEVKKRKE